LKIVYNIHISIIIPTYRRKEYLKQALLSAVQQTYQKTEVIIVYDGSRDNVKISNMINGVPIRVYHLDQHSGGAVARNFGVSKSRYDWIAFLDDDDIWAPDKLKKQVEYITHNPEIEFVYNNHYIFDSKYRICDRKILSHHFSCDDSLFQKNLIIYSATGSTSSFLIKKSAFEKVDGFDNDMPSAQDHDLALRLLKSGTHFYCIPEPLLFYRDHQNKISMDLHKKLEGRNRIIQTKKRLFPELYQKYESEILFLHNYALTFVYLFNRMGKASFKHAAKAYRLKQKLSVYLKLNIIIILSIMRLLPLVMNTLSFIKQIKYYSISRYLQDKIRSFQKQSVQ